VYSFQVVRRHDAGKTEWLHRPYEKIRNGQVLSYGLAPEGAKPDDYAWNDTVSNRL